MNRMREYIQLYRHLGVLTLCLGIACISIYLSTDTTRPVLTVAMLDIGQGDAIFITSPSGNQIIVDAGPGKTIASALPRHMPLFDRDIDMIVVTNPDRDHFEGFMSILASYTVDVYVDPGVRADENPLFQELTDKVEKRNIPMLTVQAGDRIDLGGGAYIDILFPDRSVPEISHNDGSLVAKLVYGKTSLMLTGDSTIAIEKYLVSRYGTRLKSNILKVAHHGSRTSTGDEFVREVGPAFALISAGKGNSYGHPHKETLDTLQKENVPVFGTYDEGDIVFTSDGLEWTKR